MKLRDLIDRLQEYAEELGDDVEVQLMTQKSWPFENGIEGLASSAEINEVIREDIEDDEEGTEDDEPTVVFIVQGEQLGYGSKAAWDAAH